MAKARSATMQGQGTAEPIHAAAAEADPAETAIHHHPSAGRKVQTKPDPVQRFVAASTIGWRNSL